MDVDPVGNNIVSQLILLIFLTLINAIFACAEMATVSGNKNKIKRHADDGNKNAIAILRLLEDPSKFLSTIQVVITLTGFFASASAATSLADPFGQALLGLNVPYSSQLAFVMVTVTLSYFTLVFGELVPKRIAMQNPEKISMIFIQPVSFVAKVASPFIRFLTFSTNIVLKAIGIDTKNLEDEISKDEIKTLVAQGQVHGIFNLYERDMINSVIEFENKQAVEIMTPRIDVFTIDITDDSSEYLSELLETKFSRIPVYENDIDNIIGILYIKDFLKEAVKLGASEVDIRSLLVTAYLVPENKDIDELFKELQAQQKHIAILIDEYGGFSGIVTLEDLVEEVMGEIEDEYDNRYASIEKIDDSTYLIDGLINIDELNYKLNLSLNSENSDTLSGLLIDIMGCIPKESDKRTIRIDNLVFKLVSVKKKRIDKIRLSIDEIE